MKPLSTVGVAMASPVTTEKASTFHIPT